MALSDKKPEIKGRTVQCSVGILLNTMTPEDKKTAEEWFNEPIYTSKAIFERFKEEGYICARSGVSRHRKGACQCGTS